MAVSPANQATAATTSAESRSESTGIPGAPKRVSFAKIREPLNTPNLLDVQIQSFQWFTGDEAWFERRVEEGEENPVGGLEEVGGPIEQATGGDAGALAGHLDALIGEWESGALRSGARPDMAAAYTREAQTAVMAEALNRVVSGGR